MVGLQKERVEGTGNWLFKNNETNRRQGFCRQALLHSILAKHNDLSEGCKGKGWGWTQVCIITWHHPVGEKGEAKREPGRQ